MLDGVRLFENSQIPIMALQSTRDIPLRICSANASAERRVTPSWSVAQLRAKLEPITGIPPACQELTLRLPGRDEVVIEAQDEEVTQVAQWNLQAYAEIHVRQNESVSAVGYGMVVERCTTSRRLAVRRFSKHSLNIKHVCGFFPKSILVSFR